MQLEDLQIILKVAEFLSITRAATHLDIKSCLVIHEALIQAELVNVIPEYSAIPAELWMLFPSRQVISPAALLLRDRLKKKCHRTLKQLIEADVLDSNVLI